TDGAILSLDKDIGHLWSRTHVGRHCYRMQTICAEEESESPVEEWLNTLACLSDTAFQSTTATSVRQKSSSLGAAIDPFQDLPRPSMRSVSFSAVNNNSSGGASDQQQLPLFDITGPEMLQYIQSSSRCPDQLFGVADDEQLLGKLEKKCHKNVRMRNDDFALYNDGTLADAVENGDGWCRFVSSFGLLAKVRHAPSNFHREIRHLDLAQCREVHKVAVIYVAKDQQDKLSILSNSCGSNAFNNFVNGLGWTVHIGSPHFHGYTGGLPHGQLVPYYCSANTELIFHVSTLLNGDNTQRLKHLGNDEV
uniref:Rap-GAP domain-containing protein n=1 Tax=Globodera pallida TaxID=36090 RepID=A0A183CRF1_GLOPA